MNRRKPLIAPSLLAADPLRLEDAIKSIEIAGADMHHVDVMDGHFVPNLSFGLPMVRRLKEVSSIPLDVHIMVSNPEQVALDYVEAGADILVFPYESCVHHHRLLEMIKQRGAKAGIALNPGTPISSIEDIISDIDVVNIMSVNPGFGGQSFIPASLSKIKRLAGLIKANHAETKIQVDGGVTDLAAPDLVKAGADILVAGTFVYRAPDLSQAIQSLR